MRGLGGSLLHAFMKIVDRYGAGSRIAADLVEREQPVETIEGGILQRFCHHRAGELLDLEREAAGAGDAVAVPPGSDEVERKHVAQEIEDADIRTEPIGMRL